MSGMNGISVTSLIKSSSEMEKSIATFYPPNEFSAIKIAELPTGLKESTKVTARKINHVYKITAALYVLGFSVSALCHFDELQKSFYGDSKYLVEWIPQGLFIGVASSVPCFSIMKFIN